MKNNPVTTRKNRHIAWASVAALIISLFFLTACTKKAEEQPVDNPFFSEYKTPFQVPPFRHNPQSWEIAKARLEELRRTRDSQKAKEALDELRRVSLSSENVMPATMKAVQAYVTAGEIGNMWREIFSIWNAPVPI